MQRTSPVHYIDPSVISIIPNANNSVSDLAVHITNNAKIKVYSNGIQQLSYNAKGNFQEWTIAGLNRRLTADINSVAKVPYTIYARLLRDDKTKGYLIFTPQRQQGNEWIDKYPYVTNDGLSKTYYGTPSNKYWYIRLGEVTVPVDGKRTVELDTGILGTDLYNSEWNTDPDQMPLRIDIACTIDNEDAGPKPYVPWGKTLVLTAGLLEGWATTDVERFDHWTITRNSGLSDADLIWNLSHAASFSKTGTIVLTHARGRGDDFGGSVSTLFTIAAWQKNDAYDPEDDLSEEPEFLQMTQASVNIMAETVEKFELSFSTNIVGYNPQTEMYNPGSGVDLRIRATDQRSDVFDLTGAQFTNAQLQVSWATVDSDTWTNVSFEGTPTAVAVGNISVDAFAAQKSIVVRLTRQIGTVEHPDTMELTRATVAYVRDGEDSRDREWIFIRTLLPDNYGTLPSLINVGEVNPEGHAAGGSTPYDATLDEWVPQGWWDEQQGVDEVHLYEYGSYRDYIRDDEGEGGHWGQFTRPRIWGHWGDDAVTYDIVPDVSVINADSKGNVTSDGIVVRAYRTKGTERSSNILPDPDIPEQGDYYMAEYSIDGKPWTACAKFLHLEETSGGEKITVYRYGVESSVVKTSKKTVSFRLKHTSDTTVTLKETTPIKVLRIITEEEAEELIEQYGKKLFLSKIDDDTAEGLITLLKGIQVGYRYTPDIFGEGGVFRMNAEGKVELVTDFLYTRVKAYFDNVEIRDYQHTSGNRIASQAQGFKCARVEWFSTNNQVLEQTQANRSNVAYFRCYWRVDDGQKKTDNQFIVGDLAFCQSAEVKNDSLVTNRFWRLVIGRNEGTTTTEKGEAWIDLSNAHNANGTPKMTTITWEGQGGVEQSMQALSFEAGSGFPMAEDDICQLGDVRDATRQGAIIEYVSGIDSPTYQIYQDIGSDATNPYSLNNKNYIGLGYNTATGRAYMNVFGDAYIGDRNRNTYVEYKQSGTGGNPELNIKAIINATSPIRDGNTTYNDMQSYIEAHSSDWTQQQIDDLIHNVTDPIQQQIDGAIDTWFYDYMPVHKDASGAPDSTVPLNVEPYKTWNDADIAAGNDKEKRKHLGDVFYDNKSGYAFRFANTEPDPERTPVFAWTVITDSAVIKALADAAKAQDTADHKRRIFVLPITIDSTTYNYPYPPYDVGDLWVNAKYPYDTGATYNNEILKCITAKAESGSFAIADWDKASKYTDDTRVEYYMNILTNGMLNPQTDKEIALATQHAIQTALGGATIIDGGLMLTSLIYLRKLNNAGDDPTNPANYTTYAGISGVYDSNLYGGGIAAWYGGSNIDKRNATTGEYDVTNGAKTGFRFDGSGWLANGNIYWNEVGAVTIKNITTLSDSQNNNLLNELTTFNNAFHFTTTGQGSTTVLSITPQVPFTSLEILDTTVNPSVGRPVATQKWVNDNYISVAFFNRLFQTYNGSTLVNANDTTTTIDSIKAMFGFWTQQYISSLGQNSGSGGGGGGATRLDALSDVAISNPTNGQVLKYNSTTGKWYNGTDSGVSSVAWGDITGKPSTISGYGISDAYISGGTITLGGNSITPITSLSGYATQSWVSTQLGSYLPLAGGTMTGCISKAGTPKAWYQGRDTSLIKTTSYSGYNALVSMKTTDGSWELGVYSSNTAYLTYITDANYNASTNAPTYQLIFPKATGTLALTSQIPTKASWNYDDVYLKLTGGTLTGTLTVKTNGTSSYNQGIRINRTATTNWATLLIGKSGDATTGTGTSTLGDGAWLIATPSSSNSLIFNLNGSSETDGLCLKGHGNTDMKWNNNTVWHAGNDGASSGLDADLLDGQHGSYYAAASSLSNYLPLSGGTITGVLTITKNTTYPLVLSGMEKFCVINFKDNNGTAKADIGWLNDSRGNNAYIANISSSGVLSVNSTGCYYTDTTSNFNKYKIIHTGNLIDSIGTSYVKTYLNVDVDPSTTHGYYAIMTTKSGITTDWWHILHMDWGGAANWRSELALPTQNREGVYYRTDGAANWTWKSWIKLLDANNYSSYALPLAGGTLTGNVKIKASSGIPGFYVNTNADTRIAYIGSGSSTPGSGSEHGILQLFHNGSDAIRLYASPNANSWINNGGNFGIGDSTPSVRLYVKENRNSVWASIFSAAYSSSHSSMYICHSAGYGVWIGASTTDSGHYLMDVRKGTSGAGSGGSSVLYVRADAKVGICTGSPSYALHVAGDIYATGAVSCLSDERFKNIKGDTTLTVDQIAKMPSIKYTWNDGREDKDVHVGSIAQRWMEVLPEVVLKANDEVGTLSINYGVAAMIASITTARKVVDHERRIKELEKENERLRTEIEQLRAE